MSLIQKQCTGCHKTKELPLFRKDSRNTSSGYSAQCVECHVKYVMGRRNKYPHLKQANLESVKKAQKNTGYPKKYRQLNKDKRAAYEAKRRAAKLQATPKWLSEAQLKEIQQFYTDASYLTYYTKTAFEVDHIVPLKGKNISGLHVPWNLQLLTQKENGSKHNKIKVG